MLLPPGKGASFIDLLGGIRDGETVATSRFHRERYQAHRSGTKTSTDATLV